jgi:hypothetical protein
LRFRTFEDSHGSGKVVDPSGSFKCGGNNGRGRDEIVGEGVVQVALNNYWSVKSYEVGKVMIGGSKL